MITFSIYMHLSFISSNKKFQYPLN